jgi:DNA polymerase III delta prime subunit
MRQVPPRWSGVVGNKRIVRYLRNVAKKIRTGYAETGTFPSDALLPILVSGPSRTGKSAAIKLFLRTLVCQALDDEFNPCEGNCKVCREQPEVFGMSGLYTVCATAEHQLPIHMSTINCADVESRQALKDSIQQGLNIVDGLVVLFLDEAHRLAKGHFDSSLLTSVDDTKVLWIVATAKPDDLEEMFTNRFHLLSTERPTIDDMADWLSIKCEERNIAYEDNALFRLIEKCDRVPGMALHALAVAAVDPEGLTLDFVENGWNAKPS